MADKKQTLNLAAYLESKEMELKEVDDSGNAIVEDAEGKKFKFNPQALIKSKGLDPTKFDYSLNTSATAMENSPVTAADRLKMSFGNSAGKIDFLKKQFEQVKYDPEGALVVKKNGVWHQVDPEGLGDGNPWEMTKELMADLSDAAPTIAFVGGSVGAAALTGGTSLAVQAGAQAAAGGALEGIRTSLGRALGTYKATAEEQIQDIGIEMLMNLGGTYVAAGAAALAKGAKGYLVQKLGQAATNLSKANPESQKVLSQILGPVTVGADAVDEILTNPGAVTSHLDDALKMKSEAAAADYLVEGQATELAKIAGRLPKAMSDLYTKTVDTLMKVVPGDFKSNLDDVHKGLFGELMNKGMVIVSRGKNVIESADDLLKGTMDDSVNIGIKSFEDFAQAMKASGMPDEIATSRSAYNLLAEYIEFLNKMPKSKLSGQQGAKQMLEFKRIFAQKTKELASRAYDEKVNFLGKLFAGADEAMDANIKQGFVNSGIGSHFDNIYGSYRQAAQEAAPLIEAHRKLASSQGNILQIFQPELTKVLSAGGKNIANKRGLGFAVDLIGDKSVKESFDGIFHREAAKKFVPKFSSYIKPAAFLAAGAIPHAVMEGDPQYIGGFASVAALTSPRLIGRTLAKSAGAGLLIQTGFKQLDFVRQLGKAGARQLVNNPALLNSFLQMGAKAADASKQMQDLLVGQAIERSMPTPTPMPVEEPKKKAK